MGGFGSGRKPGADTIVKRNVPSKTPTVTPIGDGIFLPDYSGVSSHDKTLTDFDARFVNVSGDTMTGNLDLGANILKTDNITESSAAKGVNFSTSTLKVNTIEESTTNSGVTIDGALIKDLTLNIDTINESTAANGITIDGVKLKDNEIEVGTSGSKVFSTVAGSLTNDLVLDNDEDQANSVSLKSINNIYLLFDTNNNTTNAVCTWRINNSALGSATTVMNLIEDGTLEVDTISELTTNNGVSIDSVRLKDGGVRLNNSANLIFLDNAGSSDVNCVSLNSSDNLIVGFGVGSSNSVNIAPGGSAKLKISGTGRIQNNSNDDITVSSGTTGGSGSAGSGNQYIEIDVNGTVYKVLHDGTV